MLAAVLWAPPHLGRPRKTVLLLASQSLWGWTRLHPPTSRPPIPRSVMAEIARQQALAGEMEPALLTWILF